MHASDIVSRSYKMLGFIMRNACVFKIPKDTIEPLARAPLEYCSVVLIIKKLG